MRIRHLLFVSLFIAVVGCSKGLSVDSPSVNISLSNSSMDADTLIYHLGDTVSFQISGNVGNLAFYPGISGYNYDYRNRTLLDSVNPVLSFSSSMQYGTQTNTLHVLATKNLGGLDSSNVVNASWTDVTSRAIIPTVAYTVTASGNVGLKDIASSPDDTLYVAFKYLGTTGTTQRTWTITNYALNNILTSGSVNITSVANETSYWTIWGRATGGNIWAATSTQLSIVGGAAAAPTRDCWIVSRPIVVGSVSNDYSIAVKSISDANINSYSYVYSSVGTYKAVWVAFNNSSKDNKSIVKVFYIRIEP